MEIIDYCNKYINRSAVSAAQRKLMEKELDKLEKRHSTLEIRRSDVANSICKLKERLGKDKIARMAKNFKLSADHIKLLKCMRIRIIFTFIFKVFLCII